MMKTCDDSLGFYILHRWRDRNSSIFVFKFINRSSVLGCDLTPSVSSEEAEQDLHRTELEEPENQTLL